MTYTNEKRKEEKKPKIIYKQSRKERLATELREKEREEKKRLANERANAAYNILKEKLIELTNVGLFEGKRMEIKAEGKAILNDIIKLLKANPSLGVDIALKKNGKKSVRKWRAKYLNETFIANDIFDYRFEVDKISNYESTSWAVENKIIAISGYRRWK